MGSNHSKNSVPKIQPPKLKPTTEETEKIEEKGIPPVVSEEDFIIFSNNLIIPKCECDPDDKYFRMNLIGEGSFASVYRVQSKITGQIRAMKIIKKANSYSFSEDKEILTEINILTKMDHPNILKIFEYFSDSDSIDMIIEYCPNGDLCEEIMNKGPYDEKQCSFIMFQILSAVNYCHKMNIIHRDLKPENILISSRENGLIRIKIADFGTAKMFEKGGIEQKVIGTTYYMAPEVINKDYNEKCDIWSCGVILYMLLTGRPPFGGNNDYEIMEKIKTGKFDLSSPPFDTLSPEVKDLISSLLEIDVNKRLSAQDALKHNWFKNNNSHCMINKIKNLTEIENFLKNLKVYKPINVIQETALAFLVHNYCQREDILNACKLFSQMDTSGDGRILKTEFIKGLKEQMENYSSLEKDVDEIFEKLDSDGNGFIQYEEFVRGTVNKKSFLNEDALKFAFNFFDKDENGKICLEEIREIFEESVKDKSKVHECLKKIISQVDTNIDGKISFQEFSVIMQKLFD